MTASMTPLGEVADFINGVAFKADEWTDVGTPIIRIQNLNDATKPFNKTTRFVPERNTARHGDLLVSWAASLGVYEWRGEKSYINQHIFKVIPDESKIDRAYLRRALETSIATMESQMHGATMKHITREKFLSVPIPLPSLSEQQRVAAILDKADALRAKRREAIAKLDQLKQSVFLEMFGDPVINSKSWTQIPFEELLENIDSGKSPVCLERPVVDGEWGVLKLGAVTRCIFDPAENKALPPGTAYDPNLEVKKGDLLFTRKNTYDLVAACAYVSETPPPRLLLPDLIFRFCLKPDAPLSARYLQSLLTHPGKRKSIQSLAGGAAGSMPNISKTKLKTVLIELPPQALQEQYEKAVKSIEAIKANQLVSLGKMDAAFMSLQQSLFQGNCAT